MRRISLPVLLILAAPFALAAKEAGDRAAPDMRSADARPVHPSAPASADVYAPGMRTRPGVRASRPRASGPPVSCIPCGELTWVVQPSVPGAGGAPGGVEGAMAGAIGASLYVSHGLGPSPGNVLRIFDTVAATWSFGPPASFSRTEGTGAAIGTSLYVAGGRGAENVLEIFDTVSSTWTTGPAMPTPRNGAGAASLAGKLHVVGGRDGTTPNTGTALSAHEVFDPATNLWTSRAPMPIPLGDCYATVAIGTKLYVFGGWNGTGTRNDTLIYDDATDTWSTGAPMPTARSNALAGVLAGRAVVIGGIEFGPFNLATTEVYDPETDTWCTGPPKLTPSSELAASAAYTTDTIYAVGSGIFGAAETTHEALVLTGGSDVEPPVLTCPDNLTLECPADDAVLRQWRDSATATDNCDAVVIVTSTVVDHQPTCGGAYVDTYLFTARDAAGNTSTCTRTVTVTDTTSPVLSGIPPDATVECDAVPPPAAPAVTDTCDPSPTVTFVETRTDGACPESYTLTRTWTGSDGCGNSTSATQVIVVVDTAPPVLTGVPPDATVECDAVPPPAAPVVTDACDPDPSVTFVETRTDGSCPDAYTLTRTWTATDSCGNSASATQVIAVVDTTPPVLAGVPPDTTAECDAVPPPATPTATDNCAPPPAVTVAETRMDGNCPGNYELRRTWRAEDRCGNAAEASQRIIVVDTTPPDVGGCLFEPLQPAPPQGPRSPRAPGSPGSAGSDCVASARVFVRCGTAADACSSPVTVSAEVRVRRTQVVGGVCTTIEEHVPVACDEELELRPTEPACPARPPRRPRGASSPRSEGVRVLAGEELTLVVTATDACGNAAACTAVPDPPLCVTRDPGCCVLAP